MGTAKSETPKFSEGQEVELTRTIQGVVKGAKATIKRIHPKPRFDEEAYLRSDQKTGGKNVADLRLQTGSYLDNVPLDALKEVTRK